MFIFFVSYMSPRGLGVADAYHLDSTPIPEVIVVAVPPPKKDWFSAIPKGRQANAPFGQILSALAIGSLIAPIYYISNPLITTSYISLVTNNELLYVPKGTRRSRCIPLPRRRIRTAKDDIP